MFLFHPFVGYFVPARSALTKGKQRVVESIFPQLLGSTEQIFLLSCDPARWKLHFIISLGDAASACLNKYTNENPERTDWNGTKSKWALGENIKGAPTSFVGCHFQIYQPLSTVWSNGIKQYLPVIVIFQLLYIFAQGYVHTTNRRWIQLTATCMNSKPPKIPTAVIYWKANNDWWTIYRHKGLRLQILQGVFLQYGDASGEARFHEE